MLLLAVLPLTYKIIKMISFFLVLSVFGGYFIGVVQTSEKYKDIIQEQAKRYIEYRVKWSDRLRQAELNMEAKVEEKTKEKLELLIKGTKIDF